MRHLAKVLLSVVLLGLPVGAGAQEAGRLISADPVAQAPDGVQAWRVRDRTRDDRPGMREVSGMVLAPSGTPSRQPRPVIAWTHGTWGTATQCAPSQSAGSFEATPAVDAVRDGYVVVAPDYPGLGNPGAHPYLVGATTARSVLDGVRAARALPGASAGPRFAVWGESQGGHAALWTGQLAGAEGSDLQLLGVAAAAPPTDLEPISVRRVIPAPGRFSRRSQQIAGPGTMTSRWSSVGGRPPGSCAAWPTTACPSTVHRGWVPWSASSRSGAISGVSTSRPHRRGQTS